MFDFNNAQLTEILLYSKEDLENINNTSVLDATINYLIETKGFDAVFLMLSGCYNIDIAFKIHFFVLFVLLCFYHFYLIIFRLFFYILYVYFFVPRNITTYICISGDCKFFPLMCRC